MKHYREYETMVIVDPEVEEEKIETLLTKWKEIIKKEEGEVRVARKWGRRKLAYQVEKRREGLYILLQYTTSKERVSEFERTLKFSGEVLRFLTTRTK
jgi:small subunit ribosomal protein S6